MRFMIAGRILMRCVMRPAFRRSVVALLTMRSAASMLSDTGRRRMGSA